MDVPDPVAERGHEALGRLAGEDRVAGVDAGGEPGVGREHPAHARASVASGWSQWFSTQSVMPAGTRSTTASSTSGATQATMTGAPSAWASSNVLRDGVGVGGVEAACADRGRFEAALAEETPRRASGPSAACPSQTSTSESRSARELVERLAERPVAVRIGVARDPHRAQT